ncbi:nuclear transport factor 2 family protein [Maribacter confluentis]
MAQNNKNEIAKIESKVKEIYTAMVVKDKDVLEDLTLEKLSYGHSNGKIENKSEYVDGVLNGSFQFTSITPIDQTISIVDDVGIVRHVFNGEGINNGMPAKVNIGCLLIFQKGNGNWKLLARQAFKL